MKNDDNMKTVQQSAIFTDFTVLEVVAGRAPGPRRPRPRPFPAHGCVRGPWIRMRRVRFVFGPEGQSPVHPLPAHPTHKPPMAEGMDSIGQR